MFNLKMRSNLGVLPHVATWCTDQDNYTEGSLLYAKFHPNCWRGATEPQKFWLG